MGRSVDFKLREWKLSDKYSLADNANNINIWNRVRDSFPHPYGIDDAEQYIRMVLEKSEPTTEFAIDLDGYAVGGIGLKLNSDVERITAEIGFWLGERYWNRGIMTQAVKEMISYAFSHFPIQKIYAPVFDFNFSSQTLLIKTGFQKEVTLKKAAIKNNKIIDIHYFSLIKED